MKTLNLAIIGIISIITTGMILPNAFSDSAQSAVKPNEIQTLPYNGTQFDLKINETFSIESTTFKIKLLNVTSDSRCPDTAYCIWQGQVTVAVGITQGNQSAGNFNISTLSGHDQIAFGKYVLSLTQVNPSVPIGKKISASDYVITFVISNSDIWSPLKQFQSGITIENIQCHSGFQFIMKKENGQPACVKTETANKLFDRSWGIFPLHGLPAS